MDVKSAVVEIDYCNEELEKQMRTKKLRNILRLLIIGYLIGRNVELKILELKRRREFAENWLLERFNEIEAINLQLEEIQNNATILNSIERNLLNSKIQGLAEDLSLLKNNNVSNRKEKYQKVLSKCSEKIVLQEKEGICGEISKIICDDSYLEFPRKKQISDNLTIHQDNLSFFEQWRLLDLNFLNNARKDLETNREFVENYNDRLVEKRKREYEHLFKTKKFCLDEEQKRAIVTDDKYNLVVAAAGSGKTEVLVTRIAYLTQQKSNGIEPNRILAIAFQDKARDEIGRRLAENYDISGVNVKTFHKLGKDIVEKRRDRKFLHNEILNDTQKLSEIKKIYKQKLQEKAFYGLFVEYLRFYNSNYDESIEKANILSQKEAARYISINDTPVRSRAEKEILDLFLTHKINGQKIQIEYEPDFREFQPDFRLTDFDLYLEHWGINKQGQTPANFNLSSEQYKEKMVKEKELFRIENKLFVETFSYEYDEKDREKFINLVKERVLEKLQEKYSKKFELSPMTYEEIIEVAWAPYDDPTPKDIMNFIKNAKVYGLNSDRKIEKWKMDTEARIFC
jgi:DNA helicase IV